MSRRIWSMIFACMLLMGSVVVAQPAQAETSFKDTRFQGAYTTENLDAILKEYELYDGWYWTTQGNVEQTYHGQENKPGWTDTAVNNMLKLDYEKGWYGCRWNWDKVLITKPNGSGWGECYGFAQFIGYLLSGKTNPQGTKGWKFYETLDRAKGLKVGDIIRIDYKKGAYHYQHSAVVYSVDGDNVTFIQVSGGNFNQLRIGTGFEGGGMEGTTSMSDFSKLRKGMRIWRAPDNL